MVFWMKILGLCLFLFLIVPNQVFTFEQENYPPEVIRAGSAVYQIRLPHGKGTGFFIAPDLLVTHFRLIKSVKNINEISLYFDDTLSPIKVKSLVAVSYPYDLAVLKTQGESSAYLSEASIPSPQEKFWTIGYPNINALQYHHNISDVMDWNDLYLEAGFNFGEGEGVNGSPVIDSSGNFFGIIFAKAKSQKFFIDSNHVRLLIEGRIGTPCTGSLKECVRREILRTKEMVQQFLRGGPRVGILHVLAEGSTRGIFERSWFHAFSGIRKPGVLNDVISKKDEVNFLERLAYDFNSAIAQIYLANRYFKEGWQLAKQWYARATKQKHPIAFSQLGYAKMTPTDRLYPTEESIRKMTRRIDDPRDKGEIGYVLHLFKQAVELGLPEGEYNQGVVFEVSGRPREAFEHYKRAANAGVPEAQLAVGRMLKAQGQWEESQEWLDRAARQGVVPKKPNILKRGWRGLCEVKISSLTGN